MRKGKHTLAVEVTLALLKRIDRQRDKAMGESRSLATRRLLIEALNQRENGK